MTKSMTGSFYLTETVTIPFNSPTGTRVTATVDLSAYVNVPTGQAIAIESVDFITQVGSGFSGAGQGMMVGNGNLQVQLVDLNPAGLFVRADNHSLIASGSLNVDDVNNIITSDTDLYPDNFGPASLSESFLVVNDTLYLTGGNQLAAIAGSDVFMSARIRCRVVKLSNKDWIAIAIQSTAEA
jgi:hypothetical protein